MNMCRKVIGFITITFLLVASQSVFADAQTLLVLKIREGLKNPVTRSNAPVNFSCSSSMTGTDLYTIIFSKDSKTHAYTRIEEISFTCVTEDLETILDRHFCIEPAVEWAKNVAAEMHFEATESDTSYRIRGNIFSSADSGMKSINIGWEWDIWRFVSELAEDIESEVLSSGEKTPCELGLRLEVKNGPQTVLNMTYEQAHQSNYENASGLLNAFNAQMLEKIPPKK